VSISPVGTHLAENQRSEMLTIQIAISELPALAIVTPRTRFSPTLTVSKAETRLGCRERIRPDADARAGACSPPQPEREMAGLRRRGNGGVNVRGAVSCLGIGLLRA